MNYLYRKQGSSHFFEKIEYAGIIVEENEENVILKFPDMGGLREILCELS
jgi:hypothetical protein